MLISALVAEWLKKCVRMGFAIGREPDTLMMAKLAGDFRTFVRNNHLGLLAGAPVRERVRRESRLPDAREGRHRHGADVVGEMPRVRTRCCGEVTNAGAGGSSSASRETTSTPVLG